MYAVRGSLTYERFDSSDCPGGTYLNKKRAPQLSTQTHALLPYTLQALMPSFGMVPLYQPSTLNSLGSINQVSRTDMRLKTARFSLDKSGIATCLTGPLSARSLLYLGYMFLLLSRGHLPTCLGMNTLGYDLRPP